MFDDNLLVADAGPNLRLSSPRPVTADAVGPSEWVA